MKTIYLNYFLILIVLILKKITTSIFEKKFVLFILIIEKLKTSISKKNVVKIFAEIITLRKFNKKNSIFFIIN